MVAAPAGAAVAVSVAPLRELAGHLLRRTAPGSRRALRGMFGVDGPHGHPNRRPACGVLRSTAEVDEAVAEVRRLGLPPHGTPPKNWDSLVALDQVLRHTSRRARVFDAGGAYYSRILPWLGLYGYTHLTAGNLDFDAPGTRGAITYLPMDLTRTPFADASVDAATCLSVIEHGVDLAACFREMARILRPGGVLVTSTDFWPEPVDTRGQTACGAPIRILTPADVHAAVAEAGRHGLELVAPLDLAAGEPVVHWRLYDLRYTFVVFTMRRRSRVGARLKPWQDPAHDA